MRFNNPTVKGNFPQKLFLISLVISLFTTYTFDVVFSLLIVDIAFSFQMSVGAASQLKTVASAVAVIFTLIMSFSSVRFSHKSLLLSGVFSIIIGAFGCFLAPTFPLMLLFYSLDGVGTAIVFSMAFTIVGETLSLQKRPKAVGLLTATSSLSFIVGSPVIGYIADIGGWRTSFVAFILPISAVGLILAYLNIPALPPQKQEKTTTTYIKGIKNIFANRSATACLIANSLHIIALTAIIIFSIAFHRQTFSISTSFAVIVLMGSSAFIGLGNLITGFLVNKFGRKNLTVLGALISSVSTILFMNMSSFPSALLFHYLAAFFFGVAGSATYSLILEQVPTFRGTMMSLNATVINLGIGLGSAIGGIILDSLSYSYVGLILGSMGLVATILFYFLTNDPCKT